MTHSLACGDVVPGCSAEFTADSHDELMSQVSEHAAEAHGITEITPEVRQAVEGAVRSS